MVFLAGDRACKVKRAVAYPYMNFATLDRRRAACQAEIRLNRRTAPEIYLDARPIRRRPDGGLALGGDAGEVIEWVVVMRRFDQDALFDRMAARGALTPALIDRLAEEIAAFHAAAERRGPEHAPDMAWVIEESLAEFREDPALFPAGQVDRLAALSRAALGRLAPLLQERAAGGFVRHCHGDLHLRNVALVDDRPAIFDAIEFNDSLAVIDVLYDLAFMLMDLDHRGLRGLGNRLFNRYLDIVDDDEGLAALPLFLSARAAIRAKVARSIAASTADAAAAERQRAEAPDYLARAIDYLEPPPPRLVAIGGLSGTGKTTVARGLAPDLGPAPGAVIVRSDVIRKRLFGVSEHERLPERAYDRDVTTRVYSEMERRAGTVLNAGHAAIADAVFADPDERAAIVQVAQEAAVPFAGLWLEAPKPVLLSRVAGRAADASDADARVVELQSGFDPGTITWRPVDAGGGPEETRTAARNALDEV
jgi:aminoglycoside phosphotransferase family enzyme/predicted kinase